MQRSIGARDSSWNSLQDALSDAISDISTKVRHITGPTRAERQAVLGGGTANTRLEAMLNGWADQVIGKKVVVMCGAGISVAAGMPDFRDKENGVYAKIQRQHGIITPEDIFRSEVYERNPEPLCLWLQEFLAIRDKAVPTVTHLFLKILEEKGCLLRCYTQNIDGLEIAAGLAPDKVVMAHGDMVKPSCVVCGRTHNAADFENKIRAGQVPICEQRGCGAPVRPDIVFFSEPTRIPHGFQKDFDACDLLLILGTSLSVNPFGNLATRVPLLCPRMLINRDKVLIKHCRHRSRQLNFDSPKAYRDVWLGGHCDESMRHLATQLGWHTDLLRLEREFHPVDSQRAHDVLGALHARMRHLAFGQTAQDVYAALHASSRYDKDADDEETTSPTPSVLATSFGSDVMSELDCDWDLSEECCTENVPSSPHRSAIKPSSPQHMPHAFSGQSLAGMISEISEEGDFEFDMNLVDYDAGTIVSM